MLVDSPDFCIPFARRARRAGAQVLYFVSPQVWAWRRYRIRKIARRVDRMAAIFPFEPQVYAGSGLRVEFVGHPARRSDPAAGGAAPSAPRGAPPPRVSPEAARVVALLPGSRRNELRSSLPLQLGAARAPAARDPALRFALALRPEPAARRASTRSSRASRPRRASPSTCSRARPTTWCARRTR